MELVERFKKLLILHPEANHFWIAYSGGSDSQVLLHLLVTLRDNGWLKTPFTAVHINHQLQSISDEWQEQCAKQCEIWQVPYQSITLNLKIKAKQSIEAVAREHRYAAFAELMRNNDYLLTAHHADDQAETILLQLLRGSGPKGLSGMPEKTSFAAGFLWRPLLIFSQEILRGYAVTQHLVWIEDPSNTNERFTRNFLRHDILPRLKQRWPSVATTLTRTAAHCASAQQIINEVAQQDLQCARDTNNALVIETLMTFSQARQEQIIRKWIEELSLPAPATIHMQRIFEEVIVARHDAAPVVEWADVEIRRYAGKLFVMPLLLPFDSAQKIEWLYFPQSLSLPQKLGEITVERLLQHKIAPEPLEGKKIEIRFRQGGEVFKPSGGAHHVTLKKWFQERDIPPWLRDRTPLLFVGGVLMSPIILDFAGRTRVPLSVCPLTPKSDTIAPS